MLPAPMPLAISPPVSGHDRPCAPSATVMANVFDPRPEVPCARLHRDLHVGSVVISLLVALFLLITLGPLL
jgi:hypothetical protein